MNKKETKFINENMTILVLTSLLVIGVSLFCLVGLTFAWFNTSIQASRQNLVAANFDVTMTIKKSDGTIIDNVEKTYTFEDGEYDVTLKRSGTSLDSVGFANVKVGGALYNTELLNKDGELTFKVKTDEPLVIEVKPVWGTYGLENNPVLNSDTVIENITQQLVEESDPVEVNEQDVQPDIEEDTSNNDEEQLSDTNT